MRCGFYLFNIHNPLSTSHLQASLIIPAPRDHRRMTEPILNSHCKDTTFYIGLSRGNAFFLQINAFFSLLSFLSLLSFFCLSAKRSFSEQSERSFRRSQSFSPSGGLKSDFSIEISLFSCIYGKKALPLQLQRFLKLCYYQLLLSIAMTRRG